MLTLNKLGLHSTNHSLFYRFVKDALKGVELFQQGQEEELCPFLGTVQGNRL